MSNKLNVFISYSTDDVAFKKALEIHLATLKRSDKIATWNSSDVLAGGELAQVIKMLDKAQIIILLASANYIADDDLWKEHLMRAMARHDRGEAKVIPIKITEFDAKNLPFSKIQSLPRSNKAIGQPSNDEAWAQVASEIRLVVEDMAAQKQDEKGEDIIHRPHKTVDPPPKKTQDLKKMLADGNIKEVLDLLPDTDDVIHLKSRFNRNERDYNKGILDRKDYRMEQNKITEALLGFLDSLNKNTDTWPELDSFNVTKNDMPAMVPASAEYRKGVLLHNIPTQMQLHNQHLCLIRVAFDKEMVLENLPLNTVYGLREIKVSKKMEVSFIDNNYFEIQPLNNKQQAIFPDEATEWQFKVKPLQKGKFPLEFKVAILLNDTLKEVVLRETVLVDIAGVPEAMIREANLEELITAPKAQENQADNNANIKGDNNTVIQGVSGSTITIGTTKIPDKGPPKQKILFLAANPEDASRMQTDREYRIIKAELERGSHRDQYEFLLPQLSLTITELLRAMNDKPNIVHFAGHGTREGIVIVKDDNTHQVMPTAALQRLFRQVKGITEIVVFNACHSAEQAKIISQLGMYVVGNNLPIGDDAAINFAKGLYTGLSEGKSLQDAYDDALIVLLTQNPDYATVVEIWKDGEKLEW